MSRVHDMGGRFGEGRVAPAPEDAPVFAQDWHARTLALTLAAGALGRWNLDISRHARECLSPADYMAFSYYEKWLAGLADLLVARGVITRAELSGSEQAVSEQAGAEPAPSALAARRLRAEAVPGTLARGGPTLRDGPAPRFEPGDTVRTRQPARNAMVDGGHTRLPGYAAGLVGVIERRHGCHVFPDANAHDMGERPEPLYTVVFAAAEVWGTAEAPGDRVSCDLWESYLEPAT